MSKKNEVQKAVQEAKNDLEQEETQALKQKVKAIVKATLEKIDKKRNELAKNKEVAKVIEKEIRFLKDDLKDLESGRLDLIEERQTKDEDAKEISVVIIKKLEKIIEQEKEIYPQYPPYRPWQWPYEIFPKPDVIWQIPQATCSGSDQNIMLCSETSKLECNITDDKTNFTANGQSVSHCTAGSYKMDSGNVVSIRPSH